MPDRFGVRRHVCALVSRGTRAPRSYFTRLTALRDLTLRSAPIQSGVMPPHSKALRASFHETLRRTWNLQTFEPANL